MEKHKILELTEGEEPSECSINGEDEVKRVLVLGAIIKDYMNKNNIMWADLSRDELEALGACKSHDEKQNLSGIKWRGWQMDLRKYLDEKCDTKVIWVIGENGNEGKSYFQENIHEEYGYSKVCIMDICENSRISFHILRWTCTRVTDIFLFNISHSQKIGFNNYKILESIKDGFAISGKYNAKKLVFKKPNIVIVFSNDYPRTAELSKDR